MHRCYKIVSGSLVEMGCLETRRIGLEENVLVAASLFVGYYWKSVLELMKVAEEQACPGDQWVETVLDKRRKSESRQETAE